LLAYRSYRRVFNDLLYWASNSGRAVDVDFLAVKGDQMVAIEIKSGALFQEAWCKGLRAFGSPPGLLRQIVVCPDTPDLRTADGIEVLSYHRFASILHENLLFTSP